MGGSGSLRDRRAVLRDARGGGERPAGQAVRPFARWLPSLTTAERERLWSSALDALVAIHAVDWAASHSFLLDDDPANASVAHHLDRIADWYRWAAAGREYPITDAALEHLLQRRATIDTGAPTLVWGDAPSAT